MIKKPDISPDFTIEDIHKIREWHYELRKEMGIKKYMEYVKMGADELEAMIQAKKKEMKKTSK